MRPECSRPADVSMADTFPRRSGSLTGGLLQIDLDTDQRGRPPSRGDTTRRPSPSTGHPARMSYPLSHGMKPRAADVRATPPGTSNPSLARPERSVHTAGSRCRDGPAPDHDAGYAAADALPGGRLQDHGPQPGVRLRPAALKQPARSRSQRGCRRHPNRDGTGACIPWRRLRGGQR